MFWSDLGSAVGFEAIGLVDSSLPTFAVFAKFDSENPDNKRLPYEDLKENAVSAPSSKNAGATEIAVKDSRKVDNAEDDYGKGVVFYMKDNKIVGILLWNVFNRISIARKILMLNETFDDLNEVAKLFDIFEQQNQERIPEKS